MALTAMVRAPAISTAGGIDADVPAGFASTVGVECERAACHAVVLSGLCADGSTGAMAQVDAATRGQRQLAVLAGRQFDDGTVGAVDDLAVAVDAQGAAMRIEQSAAGNGQVVARFQANAADPLAAGINRAVHGETAVVDRHIDFTGLDVAADVEVTLLELKTTPAENSACRQALIQCRELAVERAAVAQILRADIDGSGQIRHQRAAGIVIAAARAEDAALQIDHARSARQRSHLKRAGTIVLRRQINHRAGCLTYIAAGAF